MAAADIVGIPTQNVVLAALAQRTLPPSGYYPVLTCYGHRLFRAQCCLCSHAESEEKVRKIYVRFGDGFNARFRGGRPTVPRHGRGKSENPPEVAARRTWPTVE